MKNSFLKIVFVFSLFLVIFVLPSRASAAECSSSDLSGYAWSSNIGWISFNSAVGATYPYKVYVDASGYLNGYAWSPNIGWIKFGNGLSGFPTGGGTNAQNAQIVNGKLIGWARALSADSNGWDGWISLTGTNYGVTQSGTNLSGYAWGSDVVGWIYFGVNSSGRGVDCGGGSNVPVVSLAVNQTSGIKNIVNPTLTWSATNNPTSCTASSDWSGSKAISGTNQPQGVLNIAKTYTYSLTCANANGSGPMASVSVLVTEPILTLSASFSTNTKTDDGVSSPPSALTVPFGSTVNLNWVIDGLTSCTLRGSDWNRVSGTKTSTGYGTIIFSTSGDAKNHTFVIDCNTLDTISITLSRSITITVSPETGGTCQAKHSDACVSGTKSSVISGPSIWSWTCGAIACSEKRSPVFIEN